jgi:hypothetical protein
MASSKQKLQGLISAQTPIQKGTPYTVSADAADAPPPVETAALQRGAAFIVSTSAAAEGPLPEAVLALRAELREIARSYIGARRRSGRALLEAARWLSEARAAADHGEWEEFLAATETTADTAERLRRIYDRSMQHPAFAAAVADGRLNQSAAERLARDSTPVEVIDVVLTAEKMPTVAEVERAIRAVKRPALVARAGKIGGQIPQIAEFGGAAPGGQIPQFAEFGGSVDENQIPQIAGFAGKISAASPVIQLLREVTAALGKLAARPESVPPGAEASQLLHSIEQSLSVIRSSVLGRSRPNDGE